MKWPMMMMKMNNVDVDLQNFQKQNDTEEYTHKLLHQHQEHFAKRHETFVPGKIQDGQEEKKSQNSERVQLYSNVYIVPCGE